MQRPNGHNAAGIDVSENNGWVDWHKVRAAGYVFAIAKATEGASMPDPTFVRNYRDMRSAGVLRGAYCFARPATSSAIAEADSFIDAVERAGGFDELPPFLDLEDSGGKSPHELAMFVLDWERRVRERTGQQLHLYTSPAFVAEHLYGAAQLLAHIPLWIADYGAALPVTIGSWSAWTFYQHSESGHVAGISGPVDLNWFTGSLEELVTYIGKQKGAAAMQIGATGDAVRQLQVDLKKVLGLANSYALDGQFGIATQAAVKTFQYRSGFPTTGIADSRTMTALTAAVARLETPAAAPQVNTQSATPAATPDMVAIRDAVKRLQDDLDALIKAIG